MSESALYDLQKEIFGWEFNNFGRQSPYVRLMGMYEELGEFVTYIGDDDQQDALADILIFGLNYISAHGLVIDDCLAAWTSSRGNQGRINSSGQLVLELVKVLGLISHHDLKRGQGIRGTSTLHHGEIARNFGCLWETINLYCVQTWSMNAFQLVTKVFSETVSKRDWKKNPDGVETKA